MTLPLVWMLMFVIDLLRYLFVVGPVFAVFWVWGKERWRRRSLNRVEPSMGRMIHDAFWSMSTVLVFSVFGVGIWYGKIAGIFRHYNLISTYGWAYFFFSIAALILLHDTYFYWTHRAMHHPRIYRLVHHRHHLSTHTSPWTAYAFSPYEAAVHACIVPLVMLLLPLHDKAVFVFLLFMMVRNALGHMAIELYRPGFTRSGVWGWITTTTHHALHHRHHNANFGLYFTFWDRLMGTTHATYHDTFEDVAAR